MTAPEPPPRIWVAFRFKDFGPHPKAGGSSNYIGDANNGPIDADASYILATPAALAAAPEVAKLIADAVAKERERCAAILDTYETIGAESAARGVRWRDDLPAEIAAAIRDGHKPGE
jgi:hypothetical protein